MDKEMITPKSVAHNMDCMEFMRSMPDKAFHLAICDPPYGLNAAGAGTHGSGKMGKRIFAKSEIGKHWDVPPPQEYFDELFRISHNQIICGGNYFNLPPCRCFVIWDKVQPFHNFSACEYIWTSFKGTAKLFRYMNIQARGKIHPTQKPVELYNYLLRTFAKEGDTILDTHLGSASSRIAAYRLGFDFTGIELNKCYYLDAEERFRRECLLEYTLTDGRTLKQLTLF